MDTLAHILSDVADTVTIRPMRPEDIPVIAVIEQVVYTDAWTRRDFKKQLREINRVGFVAERYGSIVGYLIYAWEKDCLEILNLVVTPPHQRKGVGSGLLLRAVASMIRCSCLLYTSPSPRD